MAAGIGVRNLLASALAVAMLTAALPLGAMPSALASTAVPTFSVSVSGTAGNFFYASPTEDIVPIWEQTSYGLHEHIRVVAATRDGKSQYTFDFGTPIGKGHPFVDRFYRWAREYNGDWLPGRPAISVHGNQPGCTNQTGSFEIRDIHRSGGHITRLWLVFERWCNSGFGPVGVEHGELRLGYPAAAYDVSPRVVVWPWTTLYPGQTAPENVRVTVRLTSSRTVTGGTPSVSGADAADFPIRRQNCTGSLTAAGCTVWVGFTPTRPGPRHATLTVPTSAGPTHVSLDGTGGVGTSNWTVDVDWEPPTADEHLVMGSVTAGMLGLNPQDIFSEAFEPRPDGTYLLWQTEFRLQGGSQFQKGSTYIYDPASGGYPFSMWLGRGTGGCGMHSGSVTFDDLAWLGPDHDLARMDAQLTADCGNYKLGARLGFHARADITPPGPVTGLKAVRNGGRVTLTWSNPPAPDLAGVIVRWSPARNAPSVWWAGKTAYLGTGTSASFTAPATTPVSITAWTYDQTGNVSNGSSAYLS